MRLLYSASLVIMLIDILTKSPIKNAVILCNGKQNPYVSKDDGYYVFCNLSPGSYKIFVSASGYVNKEFDTSIEFGESKKFILFLSFQSTNLRLLNVPRIEFLIKKNKQILKNQEIKFISKTPEMIKMIQKIKKGDQEVILNVPENNFFIFQNFIYLVKYEKNNEENKDKENDEENKESEKNENDEKKDDDLDDEIAKLEAELNDLDSDDSEDKDDDKEQSNDDEEKDDDKERSDDDDKDKDNNKEESNEEEKSDSTKESEDNDNKKEEKKLEKQETLIKNLLFIGYDRKFSAYILEKESDIDIPIGGNFYPYWNLQTDSKGKVVIPFSQKLINEEFIIFEISFDNYMRKRKINLKKMDLNRKILTVRINFKDKNQSNK